MGARKSADSRGGQETQKFTGAVSAAYFYPNCIPPIPDNMRARKIPVGEVHPSHGDGPLPHLFKVVAVDRRALGGLTGRETA